MGIVFTAMFTLVPLFIGLVFVLVIGGIVVGGVRSFLEWQENNAQPVVTATVRVATKRQHVSGGGHDSGASTSYYATFETVDDGLRQEFQLGATEYSGLAEGDVGSLMYQGTRFKGFVRHRFPAKPVDPIGAIQPPPGVPDWTCAYCKSRVAGVESKCPACGSSNRLEPSRDLES